MIDRLMNQVNILEKGLDAVTLNNDVLAGNIANADTTGYKSKSVNFESVFQEALDSGSLSSSKNATRQAYKDFLYSGSDNSMSGTAVSISPLKVGVTENSASTIRMDGNNVDIDEQMAELAKNSVLYEALTYSVSKELGRIKMVINEGK